jgi:hypothetical protein
MSLEFLESAGLPYSNLLKNADARMQEVTSDPWIDATSTSVESSDVRQDRNVYITL